MRVVIVLHVCSHLGSLHFPAVFSFLYFNGFHYYNNCYYYFILVYFDWVPQNVFQCDFCPSLCCLILFCLSLHCGDSSVVDTAGHRGGSILQGLGCWPNEGLFWAPDHHLQCSMSFPAKEKN